MIRSFLPVGQGSFYTEQFDCGENVVYDCGSSTGVDYVNNMIKSTFAEKEKISMVFISHWKVDYINNHLRVLILFPLLKHIEVQVLKVRFHQS